MGQWQGRKLIADQRFKERHMEEVRDMHAKRKLAGIGNWVHLEEEMESNNKMGRQLWRRHPQVKITG